MKSNKVLITGMGRSGTTFLMRLFTELKFDTGYTSDNYENFIFKKCNSGLESYAKKALEGKQDIPYIVKGPYFSDKIPELNNFYNIDMIIVPIRHVNEVTKSRLRYIGDKGGLMWTDNKKDQEKKHLEKMEKLISDIIKFDLPHVYLKFPDLFINPEYTYEKLSLFMKDVPFKKFQEVFEKLSRVTKSDYYIKK